LKLIDAKVSLHEKMMVSKARQLNGVTEYFDIIFCEIS